MPEPSGGRWRPGHRRDSTCPLVADGRTVASLPVSSPHGNFDDGEASSKSPLPEGSLPVGLGLLVSGVTIYAFFTVGKWALGGDTEFAPISALWFATFALAPGFFLPLEQELGRALSARRAARVGGRPVVRKVLLLGAALAGAVIAAVFALSPLLTTHYFDGDWALLFALVGTFAAYAPVHLARGITSGHGRFRDYAVVMGADGVVRIVLCVALALAGVKSPGWYGLTIAVSPMIGVWWVWKKGALRADEGPPAEWGEVTPNLGWLLLGSVFAAGLVNAGPVSVNLLAGEGNDDLVAQFAYGVLLARIPLFLFQAVQAALLPRLSRHAARNELLEFRVGLRKLMIVVIVVGVVGTLGAFVIGPFMLRTVFDADLRGSTMAMLALGSAFYMLALAVAQAVIALKGHALVALGWGIGMATFVTVTWISSDELFKRVEYGLVASSVAALVAFSLALRHQLSAGFVPDEGSILQALTDMPLES
jgi:O-antigen/teichoic acid export membrane protein